MYKVDEDLNQMLEEIKDLVNDAINIVNESAPKEQKKKGRANGH